MSKSISLARIDATRANNNDAHIGLMLCEAGETLGAYTVMAQQDSTTCLESMTASLTLAMSDGLTVDMLKAGRAAYTALVESFQNVRTANGMTQLTNATRDNYASRIRSFVRDRGANPLDVFGNLKSAEQKAAKKAEAAVAVAVAVVAESTPVAAPQAVVADVELPAFNGLAPLQKFLAAWTSANAGSTALLQLHTMAIDLLRIVNATTKK